MLFEVQNYKIKSTFVYNIKANNTSEMYITNVDILL